MNLISHMIWILLVIKSVPQYRTSFTGKRWWSWREKRVPDQIDSVKKNIRWILKQSQMDKQCRFSSLFWQLARVRIHFKQLIKEAKWWRLIKFWNRSSTDKKNRNLTIRWSRRKWLLPHWVGMAHIKILYQKKRSKLNSHCWMNRFRRKMY